MINIRRVYTYLVSGISLLAVFAAVLQLLRMVILPGIPMDTADVALQLAIVIIGTPIFIGHWLWQQRLTAADAEEQGDTLRALYLYAIMAFMLGTVMVAAFGILASIFGFAQVMERWQLGLNTIEASLYHLIALVLAAVIGAYHWFLRRQDAGQAVESDHTGTVRRLYLFGFAGAGLTMVTVAVVQLFRWLFSQLGASLFAATTLHVDILPEVTRLVVGLPVWLVFWMWAERLYRSQEEERSSVLRRFYLYLVIFVGTVGVVGTGDALLAGIFRGLLGLEPQGDIRNVIAIILGMALVWGYHSLALRNDTRDTTDSEQQAEMRRLYLYLLAGVGLVALLIGVIGDISVLLIALDSGMNDGLREMIAYFTAAIVAGLPIWLLTWRKAQEEVLAAGDADASPRQSSVRRIYLYFFLFVNIMGVLGGAVFVVFRLIQWLLGGDNPDLTEMATAIAIAIVTGLFWGYHWLVLRGDRKHTDAVKTEVLTTSRIVILAGPEDGVSPALTEQLQRAAPGIEIDLLPIAEAVARLDAEKSAASLSHLHSADVILAPWTVLVPGAHDSGGDAGQAEHTLRTVLSNSPAQKLLLPGTQTGWHWLGGDGASPQKVAQDAVEAVQQIRAGKTLKPARRLGCVAILGLIVMGIILILVVSSVVDLLIPGLVF